MFVCELREISHVWKRWRIDSNPFFTTIALQIYHDEHLGSRPHLCLISCCICKHHANANHRKRSLPSKTPNNKDIDFWQRFRTTRNIPRFSKCESYVLSARGMEYTYVCFANQQLTHLFWDAVHVCTSSRSDLRVVDPYVAITSGRDLLTASRSELHAAPMLRLQQATTRRTLTAANSRFGALVTGIPRRPIFAQHLSRPWPRKTHW